MAIAIPLIGGVREAANNAKCRSNLKQLHTAIFAYATGNKERLPNLAGNDNLESLTDGGYIESESKLGLCPGDSIKPKLPDSSYTGGADLDGSKKLSSEGINSNTIILEDKDINYHKAGKNAIRLDGSFTQIQKLPRLEQDVDTIKGGIALDIQLNRATDDDISRFLKDNPTLNLNPIVLNKQTLLMITIASHIWDNTPTLDGVEMLISEGAQMSPDPSAWWDSFRRYYERRGGDPT